MKNQKHSLSVTEQELNRVLFFSSVFVTFVAYFLVIHFLSGEARDHLIVPGIFTFFVIRLLEPILGEYAKYFYVCLVPIGCAYMTIIDGEGRYMAISQCDFVWILLSASYGQVNVVLWCAFTTLFSNVLGMLLFPTAFLNVMSMIGWIYCLIIYVISIVAAAFLAKKAADWRALERKMQVYEQEAIYFQELQKKDDANSRFVHDIGHFLKAIAELVNEKQYEPIADILQELDIVIEENTFVIYTKHRLLNAILMAKSREAKEKGIHLDILVEPNVLLGNLADGDLVIMLGNLLDNAIYAVHNQTDPDLPKQVTVRIYMEHMQKTCVIKIVNTFTEKLEKNENGFLSTKRKHKANGIGMKSVTRTAQKNGGYFHYTIQDNAFCAIVLLPITPSE